jgi:hypothetical protein
MSVVLTVWSASFFADFVRALPYALFVLHCRFLSTFPDRNGLYSKATLRRGGNTTCFMSLWIGLQRLVFVAYVAPNSGRSGGNECANHQRERGEDREGGCSLAGGIGRLSGLGFRFFGARDRFVHALLRVGLRNAGLRRHKLRKVSAIAWRLRYRKPSSAGRSPREPYPCSVPEQREKDDDRNRHAEQPKQNSATHDYLLQFFTAPFDETSFGP